MMAEPTESPDYADDVALLKRLTPMASRVHVVAAEALLSKYDAITKEEGDERKRRILAIRLVAEAMSALEDFGALCRAVRLREEDGGIISNYLGYQPGDVSKVFQEIQKESFAWNYLRLYVPQKYVDFDDSQDPNPVWSLDLILGAAARWQQVQGALHAYNSVKHGFRVLDDSSPDMENAASGPTLYLLTKDSAAEPLKLTRLWDWPERAKMVIDTCAEGWKQLADLVCYMHDNNYGLKLTQPPST